MTPTLLRGLLYLAFFTSGITALIYEVVWSKYLTLFIGSTSFAHTVVLSTFMGGLAFGNALFGRLADRMRMDRLKLYAFLELGIGLACLLFPMLFRTLSDVYVALGTRTGPTSAFNPILKIALSVFSIFAPCVLMGGTLPVLAKVAIDSLSGFGVRLSWLYFLNTGGAVAGCLVGGFYVVERLGLEFGMVGPSLVNSAIGAAFYFLSRAGYTRLIDPREPAGEPATPLPEQLRGQPNYTEEQAWTAFWCIGVAGGLTMLYELCWIRLLVMSMGGTVHSFSTMLAGFIFGIAVGSGLIGTLLRRRRNALALFGLCEIGIALSVLLPLGVYERLPFAFFRTGSWIVHSPQTYAIFLFLQVLFAVLLMLLPTALMGAALPLASRVCVDRLDVMARRVGNVFSVNTLGSVLGAALTGFVLLPAFGVEATLLIGALASGALGTVLLRAWRPKSAARHPFRALRQAMGTETEVGGPALWPAALVAIVVIGLVRLVGHPNWDARLMQVALYRWERPVEFPTWDAFRRFREPARFLYARDGSDASVAVDEQAGERFLRINGKPDASTGADVLSQLLVGHLGMFFHPAPERAMVIGLGSGGTAGAVLRHPAVTADVVEISPEVVRAASYFNAINDGVLLNPRMSLSVGDARDFLLLNRQKYDVIVSEPTNVWVPGVASLFTRDFYQIVRDRLRPGGLFTQWIQLYSSEPRIVASVVRSLRQVFPYVSVWMAAETDLLFLAGGERPNFDADRFATRLREVRPAEGMPAGSTHVELLSDPVQFLLCQIATDQGSRVFWPEGAAPAYQDAFPRMEFLAARAQFVGRTYGLLSELDERFTPLGSEPLFLTEYLRGHPLTEEQRAHLSERLPGLLPPLGRALAVLSALEGGDEAVLPQSPPESWTGKLLLVRQLAPRLGKASDSRLCLSYLASLGDLVDQAATPLGRPSIRELVSRTEECSARHPEIADRVRLNLVRHLAGAGAPREALERLEALDAEGRLEAAAFQDKADLMLLGIRLSRQLGRDEEASRWESRVRQMVAAVPGRTVPGGP